MISKLRRQFILINMSFVTIILITVFAAICTASYHKARADTISSLRRMSDEINRVQPPNGMTQPPKNDNFRRRPDGMKNEPRTPCFAVTIENSGNIVLNAAENITVDDELMNSAAEYVKNAHEDEGVISELNLRYLRKFTQKGEQIVFADRTNETQTLKNVIITSLGAGLGGLLAFFAASLFLSGVAVKPVKTAWENQRRFVADASHELKTPITVILANMNILKANSDDTVGAQMKWIDNTGEEAARMKTLVDDMLFLAKGDAQKNDTQPLPVNLSELLMGCVLQFEPVAFERGVVIENSLTDNAAVMGDAARLKQLFGTLLDNACKYADEKTKITVSLSRESSWAVVRVTNFGAVIPEEDAAHIFERFYRSEKSRVRKTGGYGLGLAIAESITKSHGGKISAQSSSECGTTFTVRLPLMK